MVEFNNERIPLYKLILHIAQIVLSVTIWCMEIDVFRNGSVNGRMGWTFGVCFLSVPAWIYLIMAPRYPRTKKLAQPNAMLCVDVLFTIIWLSAFSTQAAYNTAGDCKNACSVSKAIVGIGVFETVFWIGTSFLSIATLQYYNFNGVLPGYDNMRGSRPHPNNIDPDKAAFSTAPADEEAYAPVGMNDHDDLEPEFNASPYGGAASMPQDHNQYGGDTSYGGAGGSMDSRYGTPAPANEYGQPQTSQYGQPHISPPPAGTQIYSPPPAEHVYDDASSAHFPAASYDRINLRH